MNYHKLLQPIIAACLILLFLPGCGAPATLSATSSLVSPTAMATLGLPTTTATPAPTPPPSDTVYFGTVQGRNVIFITNDRDQALYRDIFSSDGYFGEIYCIGFDFNFYNLENPRLLFSLDTVISGISVICSGEKVYISGVRQDPDSFAVSFVYVINPKTGDFQEVWTGMPGYVDEVWNNIIVIKLFSCYFCSPSPLYKTVIVNASTGVVRELGEVGDVRILESSVAYRYLTPLEVPCDPGEGCDGYYTDYEPTGEFLIEPLP